MPTITSTGRATVGSSPEEYRLPRTTVTTSTGMNLPSLKQASPPQDQVTQLPKTGQPSTTEETPAPAVTLSSQMTAMARKDQKLQKEIQAFREMKAQWEREKADYVPKSAFKAKLQQNNVVEALGDLGTDYEEVTKGLLAQQQGADPVAKLQSEIEQMKKAQEENNNKQYDATLKQYKAETNSLIAKDPKKFLLIAKEGHQDAVVQHIVETWEENPDNVLTVEEAAADIEEFLREEARKKKAYLEEAEGVPAPVETSQPEKRLPPPRTGQRTLTQSVESAPQRTYNQFQHLSMKERIAQAIARSQR